MGEALNSRVRQNSEPGSKVGSRPRQSGAIQGIAQGLLAVKLKTKLATSHLTFLTPVPQFCDGRTWEGEVHAELKTAANGEWRIASSECERRMVKRQRMVSSE
jgi:hypothetical protein